MLLSQRIARIESAASTGNLLGRDLVIIEMQIARVEEKIIKRLRASGSTQRIPATVTLHEIVED